MRKQKDPAISKQVIQERSQFSHPNLLKTFGINNEIINTIFNRHDDNNGVYFEYLNTSLSTLTSERKASQLFAQGDLISLVKGIASALAYLQGKGVFHGDVSPESIYFDENSGCFKISDEELISGEFHCFQETRLRNRVGFIPPELIPPIRNKNIMEVKENFYKADVFALGLCVLEAATLRKSSEIYDITEMSIFTQMLYERIYFVSAYYSPELTHTIRLMLEFDSIIRPDCIQLWRLLNQKEPKMKRKVQWPSIPIGLRQVQQNKNIPLQPEEITGEFVQSDNEESQAGNEFSPHSPKQHPQMLTALPQQALDHLDALNEKFNQLQLFQKPLEASQHSQQASGNSFSEKVYVASYQPNELAEDKYQRIEFNLKNFVKKLETDDQKSERLHLSSNKKSDCHIIKQYSNSKHKEQQKVCLKQGSENKVLSNFKTETQSNKKLLVESSNISDFSLNSNKCETEKQKDDQKVFKQTAFSMNLSDLHLAKEFQLPFKQQNFKDAVDKIKAELNETKKLIENYHQKTEMLKRDLHLSEKK